LLEDGDGGLQQAFQAFFHGIRQCGEDWMGRLLSRNRRGGGNFGCEDGVTTYALSVGNVLAVNFT
jgi:hypothetical protein